jgi:DNA-binding transcriptional LysR family regulator
MDLWQLHIFCSVIEHASFSRAALAVHLSQPTVSSHIKDLEEHIGCRLVDRLGREAVPTPGGRILYDYAKRLLALRDEAENAMAAYQGHIRGTLAVGASTIPGAHLLPPVIGSFARLRPEVTVRLLIADTQATAQAVLDGAVEAGVVGAVPDDSRLNSEKLAEDTIRVILAPDHPLARNTSLTWDEALGLPFILREPGSGTRETVERHLAREGKSLASLRVVAEMGSNEAAREAAKAGIGAALLSTRAVAQDLLHGSLAALPIEGMSFSRSFHLILHRHRTPSPLCEAFLRHLRERLSPGAAK